MARSLLYPFVASVRLSEEDGRKLAQLCWATERPPSEVLRALVHIADPAHTAAALAPLPPAPYRSLRWVPKNPNDVNQEVGAP
jgi:hypothetical protein